MHAKEGGDGGDRGDGPQPAVGERVLADAMHRADDEPDHRRLRAAERALEGRCNAVRHVEPRQREHQDEAGQHEAEPGEHAAEAAARDRSEIHAQLGGLGTGQHLVHGEDAVEVIASHPALVFHELLAQHVDLGHRPAPGVESEAQEAREEAAVRLVRRSRDGLRGRVAGRRDVRRHRFPRRSTNACTRVAMTSRARP
jgi:hypothetical protein